jgi:tetratricopeptide (TPR) repeat protein
MRKLLNPLLALILLGIFLQSCQSPEEKQLRKIKALEDELFGDLTGMINREKAIELVNAYVDFADNNPNDEKAAEYLFRAADVSMNTGYPERAVELYTRVYREYPEFEKRPECLFLIAFIYENQLLNLQRAEHNYRQFLELYPDHDLADDAEILLEHLGKSPDEMVREFEERLRLQEGL